MTATKVSPEIVDAAFEIIQSMDADMHDFGFTPDTSDDYDSGAEEEKALRNLATKHGVTYEDLTAAMNEGGDPLGVWHGTNF